MLWQVLSRYILVSPSSVTDELAGYLLIWVGLLGAAYVSGKNEHLAIDLLLQHLLLQEASISRINHLYFTHHLTNDNLEVLIVNLHTL
ncbi:TRAP transporter small permease [Parabacteroides distasonis]|uniref:TRAP transporter small permease n=1 Tax=Parabacteroides distasonis TaxID=823 RepID=UPI0029345B99|nr:TRAP transporter small permease subunit [Parabacteroides distasonis]